MPTTKEKALIGLKNTPENMPECKRFFTAIIEAKLPSYYLERFRRFKGYSDVLVSDHDSYIRQQYSGKENIKAKTRVVWAIITDLSHVVNEGIIKNEALIQQIESFSTRKWNCLKGGRDGKYFTTPEELKLINAMLDTVICYLQTTYSLPGPMPVSFYPASSVEELAGKFLAQAVYFKIHSDELPDKMAESNDVNYDNLKCRGNTIAGIRGLFEVAIEFGVIKDESLIVQLRAFIGRDWNAFKRYHIDRTTQEEISLINATLDTFMDYLKATYSSK